MYKTKRCNTLTHTYAQRYETKHQEAGQTPGQSGLVGESTTQHKTKKQKSKFVEIKRTFSHINHDNVQKWMRAMIPGKGK